MARSKTKTKSKHTNTLLPVPSVIWAARFYCGSAKQANKNTETCLEVSHPREYVRVFVCRVLQVVREASNGMVPRLFVLAHRLPR